MHTEDIRCIIWAFLLWALRRNMWFCERSSRAVLAPPYSPAYLLTYILTYYSLTARGWWGVSAPHAAGWQPRPHMALRVLGLSAHPPWAGRATTQLQIGLPATPETSEKTLRSCPRVTDRLKSPLAGACHVHRVAPAIGWRVGRAQGRGGDAASSAVGRSCARRTETLCGAPGGESPRSEARRGGRAGPAGERQRACGQAGASEPEQRLGPAGPLRPRLPPGPRRARPPIGSRASKPESEARQEVRSL